MSTQKMSMVIIKPLTVMRHDALAVISDIINQCSLVLTYTKSQFICETSWKALGYDDGRMNHPGSSQVCLFTHGDQTTDPYPILKDICGPVKPINWRKTCIRAKYSHHIPDITVQNQVDDVVHISPPHRLKLEAAIVGLNLS